jgi:P-aminobenzoate N-oxygenase AurF
VGSSDYYAYPCDTSTTWDVPIAGDARFSWEYDDGRARLLALYQKGKDKQWDQTTRIDWSLELDPQNPLGLPEQSNPLIGSDMWRKSPQSVKDSWRQHQIAWQFSQFLHGEQGAMITSARIVESVPDMDAKFYAATQTMDEARHAETYERFLKEKVGMMYPINSNLQALLNDTLTDSRWDMPYLGMQVLIEGLALAAFGLLRDMTPAALPKQIVAYVMQDEARHVAFGRLALKDFYAQLTTAEKAEREEFVIDGCYLMRDRIRSVEVWENLGFDVAECIELTKNSPYMQMFQSHLFSRIVPIVKDIGLWSEKVQAAYADMGVLDMAGVDLAKLMEDDENTAERLEREHRELVARQREIDATIEVGASL